MSVDHVVQPEAPHHLLVARCGVGSKRETKLTLSLPRTLTRYIWFWPLNKINRIFFNKAMRCDAMRFDSIRTLSLPFFICRAYRAPALFFCRIFSYFVFSTTNIYLYTRCSTPACCWFHQRRDAATKALPPPLTAPAFHAQACLRMWKCVCSCIARLGKMLLYGLQGQQEGEHGEVLYEREGALFDALWELLLRFLVPFAGEAAK